MDGKSPKELEKDVWVYVYDRNKTIKIKQRELLSKVGMRFVPALIRRRT